MENDRIRNEEESMSTTYEIYKFAKPNKKELSVIDKFNSYDSFRIVDEDGDDTGWGIYLFRMDDKSISNLVDSRFAVKMVLPELVTDYEKIIKSIPGIQDYRYVPVNNSMLAKAEIPFLIFEKNRGKCFMEKY